MTKLLNKNEIKEIERVCGKNFEESDIPAFLRIEKAEAEERLVEEYRQERT